jgi:translation initiation factor 6 (eIF-6)
MIKLKRMELTLQELNEVYYCLGKVLTLDAINLADTDLVERIKDKISDEIGIKVRENINQ